MFLIYVLYNICLIKPLWVVSGFNHTSNDGKRSFNKGRELKNSHVINKRKMAKS